MFPLEESHFSLAQRPPLARAYSPSSKIIKKETTQFEDQNTIWMPEKFTRNLPKNTNSPTH